MAIGRRSQQRGRWRQLGPQRALVGDLLYVDRQIPSFGHSRKMGLAALAELRRQAGPRISWPALFLKAYGRLSAEIPELRQCYMRWPWPHIYEHPEAVGYLAVSRLDAGRPRLYWARFRQPQESSLVQLQQKLDAAQHEPVERQFKRQRRASRFPAFIRRLGWQATLQLSGPQRARRLGTFGLTTLAGQGVEIDRPPSVATSTFTYGPLDDAGRSRVTIVYDHRLFDGLLVAEALLRLETILNGEIAAELDGLRNARAAA